jgi:hypothetical protein
MSPTTILLKRLALMVALLVAAAGTAAAQYGKKQQPKEYPDGRISGEVKGVRGGALMVTDGKDAYFVQVAPNARKVDVTGEGQLAMLRPGMYVRFDVKMDKQGNGKEDITKVEVFTYDKDVARTGVESKGEEQFYVAGIIKSLTKAGKLTVDAPGDKPGDKVTVKAQLSKEATVDVGVRGRPWLSLAKAGDSATASGKVTKPSGPNSPGVLVADEIEVKLVKQAEADLEKPEPKTKAAPEKKAAKAKEKE